MTSPRETRLDEWITLKPTSSKGHWGNYQKDTPVKRARRRLNEINAISVMRRSAGMVVFAREDDDSPRVLAIRQRVSYAFRDLIFGWWFPNLTHAANLVRNISPEEWSVLRLGDHAAAYCYATCQPLKEYRRMEREEAIRTKAAAKRFRLAINNPEVKSALSEMSFRSIPWIVPRGRIDKGELPYSAALRELAEEAKLGSEKIRLLMELKSTDKYSRENGTYEVTYFGAELREPIEESTAGLHSLKQFGEIAEVRWLEIEEARYLMDERVYSVVKELFEKGVASRRI